MDFDFITAHGSNPFGLKNLFFHPKRIRHRLAGNERQRKSKTPFTVWNLGLRFYED